MDIKQAKNIMNLKVLQNHDSSIVKIIETVSHVVLYDYSLNEWKKRGIEGTLFLYEKYSGYSNQQTGKTEFGFFILNRLGLDNIQVGLPIQVQLSGEYVMYKLDDQVHGLWIFGDEDRDLLYHQLTVLNAQLQTLEPIDHPRPSQQHIQHQVPVQQQQIQQISLEEIWSSLESMAPHSTAYLSEQEFLARFQILVKSPFFARALYIGYLQDRGK